MTRRLRSLLLGLALFSTSGAGFAQAVIDVADEKQVIRGYGGINHPVWIADLTEEQRDTAFGNGPGQIGMTVLRIHVDENQANWEKEIATATRAQEHGAIVFASPWNPPTSLQVTVDGQRRLDPSKYAEYRDHLNAFVEFMSSHGVQLEAISLQNEPDYASEWTEWSAEEVRTFMVNFAGDIATKVIAPESFQYRKTMSDPILNDSAALANLDILGAHLYGTQLNQFPYPLFKQKGAGKELWMTEVYTDSANDADVWPLALDVAYNIHNSMVLAEFNAYVWWYIRRAYGMIKENGQISKRGYCMAHYSKFVRPGFVRVQAPESPSNGVHLSAYKGEGQVVIIAVNRNNSEQELSLDVAGSGAQSFDRYTTSGSKSLEQEAEVSVANEALLVNLDAQSVTTLVGRDVTVTPGTGGEGGTGGDSGAGGEPGVGGDVNTGGSGDGTGGADVSSGGLSASGGGPASGGSGQPGSGGSGQPGSGGTLTGSGGTADSAAPGEDAGCSCSAVGGRRGDSGWGGLLALLAAFGVVRARSARANSYAFN